MTEKVYHYSDALEMPTEVISCIPQEDDTFHVVLNATLFHPKGGGQPSDRGSIDDVNVLDVIQQAEVVIHITDRELPVGPATLSVFPEQRQRHTRYHSAGHIIAYAGEKYGWYGYKGNHKPGEGRIVFRAGEAPVSVSADELAREAGKLVAENLPRLLTDMDGKRHVSWGPLASYACGGTHVACTGEIGEIIITRVKEKKGELSVQYQLQDSWAGD